MPSITHHFAAIWTRIDARRQCFRPPLALLSVAQAMDEGSEQMHGFDGGDVVLPAPPIPVQDETRGRMIEVLAAVVTGATPQEITGYLDDGFPGEVVEMLDRPLEREEMSAHVDLLLTVMQSSAAAVT